MSVPESELLEVFLYAIRSPATRSRYLNRLKNFFDYLGLEGDIKTQEKAFILTRRGFSRSKRGIPIFIDREQK